MPDLRLKCVDCSAEFVLTEVEQAILQQKAEDCGWTVCVPPKRCQPCRKINRESRKREQVRVAREGDNAIW